MWKINCLNLTENKIFYKIFWGEKAKNNFVRKCKYSKKIKILGIEDWSNQFD